MFEDFLSLVPKSLQDRSGAVLYSGRKAYEQPSSIYVLGLNPAGDPIARADATVGRHTAEALTRSVGGWSEYLDVSWKNKRPGEAVLQRRVLHLLSNLDLHPHNVPASNVIFVRSRRADDLKAQMNELCRSCWPMHQAIIDKLNVQSVVCLGHDAGKWVRAALGAQVQIAEFREANGRRTKSLAHATNDGRRVFTLSHPSVANWLNPAADPIPMVKRTLGI